MMLANTSIDGSRSHAIDDISNKQVPIDSIIQKLANISIGNNQPIAMPPILSLSIIEGGIMSVEISPNNNIEPKTTFFIEENVWRNIFLHQVTEIDAKFPVANHSHEIDSLEKSFANVAIDGNRSQGAISNALELSERDIISEILMEAIRVAMSQPCHQNL